MGCKLDKLNYWKQQKAQILEVYDEDKEFFVLNNVVCMHKRTQRWGDQHKRDTWIDTINKEIELKYQIIIIANKQDSFEDVQRTLSSACKQTLKPQHITIVRMPGNTIQPQLLSQILSEKSIKWRIENIVDSDLLIVQAIDLIIKFCAYPFYCVFQAGFTIPQDTFEVLNKHIVNGTQFIIITPNSTDNGYFVNTTVHKLYNGHIKNPLIEKIEQAPDYNNNASKWIRKITDLCLTFPK